MPLMRVTSVSLWQHLFIRPSSHGDRDCIFPGNPGNLKSFYLKWNSHDVTSSKAEKSEGGKCRCLICTNGGFPQSCARADENDQKLTSSLNSSSCIDCVRILLQSCQCHMSKWSFLFPFLSATRGQGKRELWNFRIYPESRVLSLPQVAKDSVSTVRQNVREELCESVTTSARRPRLLYRGDGKDTRQNQDGMKKKNAHKSLLTVSWNDQYHVVCQFAEWWLNTCWPYCNHVWNIHAAPTASVLHVALRGFSTGTTLPLSGCATSCSELSRTKLDQYYGVHGLP